MSFDIFPIAQPVAGISSSSRAGSSRYKSRKSAEKKDEKKTTRRWSSGTHRGIVDKTHILSLWHRASDCAPNGCGLLFSFLSLLLVALRLRSLRFHSPRLCRVAVFLIQTNVSLSRGKPSTCTKGHPVEKGWSERTAPGAGEFWPCAMSRNKHHACPSRF